ncbi:MAG: helicase-related protein, partial [Candidatus Wallbacteria bacterium]|nr:helicase-related protein [Candidatus Wallbacteria bacterium]
PLQNSLLELYGLSSLIDEHFFGELSSFRTRYINYGGDLQELRERLKSFCWRSLRSQVTEFVRYTERKPITRKFIPSEQEQTLYESISSYLQRDDNYALPAGQKHLLTLLVRKVLASSPHAVAGTLCIMLDRLKKIRDQAQKDLNTLDKLLTVDEIDDDLLDELLEDDEDDSPDEDATPDKQESQDKKIDLKKLESEIKELEDYVRWARSIGTDTKAKTLLKALEIGFKELEKMGADRKAVIFTESRRTQSWLKDYLEANGYMGQVLTFNGTNKDDSSGLIYQEWFEKNKESGRASGSRQIDLRTAIIDCFKDKSSIMIATEAGAEGLNLQFCSMVVNFDMPWNPQRIEQRIGRCHRYGQKHDVVVINFLNEKNAADCRVYELLEKKFNLFSGVFGASDEILGTIESGVDFERRVLEICQECRTEKEISDAFSRLQAELEEKIKNRMTDTRRLLLEHFDEDVHDRLKTNLVGTQEKIDRIGRMFWQLTKQVLAEIGKFEDIDFSFRLEASPAKEISTGNYSLISKEKENIPGRFLYRLSHPLGEYVITKAMSYNCPIAEIVFDISNHPMKISLVEKLIGKSGWLELRHLRIESFGSDEFLLFSAFDDSGNNIDQETCEKLFLCSGKVKSLSIAPEEQTTRLKSECERHVNATVSQNLEENNHHFSEARDQLDKWAEDMEMAAQKELDDVKRQIKELQRRARQAPTMEEQRTIQDEISGLERRKRSLRERIFDIEDEISEKRDKLIAALELRMKQKTTDKQIFTIRWKVI